MALARADEPRRLDRLILDFDPSGGGFADVRAAAREAGERLRDAGLAPYAMTTGSRGIHVLCPLRRGPEFGEVHRFARAIAEDMVRDDPRRLILEWKKADRGTRIYVDVNRNNYAQHAVAPYAVRPRPKAPVAVPVRWEELSHPSPRPLDGGHDGRQAESGGRPLEGDGPPRPRPAAVGGLSCPASVCPACPLPRGWPPTCRPAGPPSWLPGPPM